MENVAGKNQGEAQVRVVEGCWLVELSHPSSTGISEGELQEILDKALAVIREDPRHVVIHFVGIGFLPTSAVTVLSHFCKDVMSLSVGASFLNLPENIRKIIVNNPGRKPPKFHNPETAVTFLKRKMEAPGAQLACCSCN